MSSGEVHTGGAADYAYTRGQGGRREVPGLDDAEEWSGTVHMLRACGVVEELIAPPAPNFWPMVGKFAPQPMWDMQPSKWQSSLSTVACER